MIYGVLQVDFRIFGVHSLKDKRSVISKMISKVRSAYPISISEVGDHDLMGNGTLGVAIAGNDPMQVENILQKVLKMIEENPTLQVYDSVFHLDQLK